MKSLISRKNCIQFKKEIPKSVGGQDKSAKWISEPLGKDKSTVSRWCTNNMQPTIETFCEIAELLDIDVHELFVPSKK